MLPRAASIIFGTVLRAAGDTRAPMKTGVVVNLVNVVLNFLFIYPAREATLLGLRVRIPGAGWGVLGAAAASAPARTARGGRRRRASMATAPLAAWVIGSMRASGSARAYWRKGLRCLGTSGDEEGSSWSGCSPTERRMAFSCWSMRQRWVCSMIAG